jgi:hypothetical protein
MAKKTKVSAWDWTHDIIGNITALNSVDPTITVAETRLRESLDRLYQMNLPLEAITELAYTIKEAYNIGKERKY